MGTVGLVIYLFSIKFLLEQKDMIIRVFGSRTWMVKRVDSLAFDDLVSGASQHSVKRTITIDWPRSPNLFSCLFSKYGNDLASLKY